MIQNNNENDSINRDILKKYIKEPIWSVYAKRADFFKIGEKYRIDAVIARIIRNRDIIEDKDIEMYLNGDISYAHEPSLMKDMEKGCLIMKERLESGSHVRIISDYDVDGVMSSYILYKGLTKTAEYIADSGIGICDSKTVYAEDNIPVQHGNMETYQNFRKPVIDYDIPHRIKDGYGINIRMVDAAYKDGVDTIITCDNGIAAFDAAARAKELGMTVIVTDHHDIPYKTDEDGSRTYLLPEADAIIDYKQQDCTYPCKELCGAGVAYKFIQLLYRLCGIPEEECQEFIEFLGIATVCDVMNLTDENRIFVKISLERLKSSRNYGLAALIRNSGRQDKKLSAFDLGFIIGPCINAAGRLGDAKASMEFLLEKDSYKAETRAMELININNQRKNMTIEGTRQAMDILEKNTLAKGLMQQDDMKDNMEEVFAGEISKQPSLVDNVIVLYIPDIHESLVGIIAGRIKERYYRPVLLFTDSEDTDILKGSGRSIEGYNMYDELSRVRHLFVKFGGHEMAAGFSIKRELLDELRVELNRNAHMDEKTLTPKLMIDVPMPLSYNDIPLTEQLRLLEPFGKGNEKPVFAQSGVSVRRVNIMGKNRNVMRLTLVMDNGETITGLNFEPDVFISRIKEWFGEPECDRILKGMANSVVLDVAYYPDINEYAGRKELQVRIIEYRKHED